MLIGDYLSNEPDHNSRRMNYGNRVEGPWVFGMIVRGTRKTRLFYVPDRSRNTLFPILFDYVDSRSTVCSDQWAAYSTLGNFFESHYSVNHSEFFVDPVDRSIHTQTVERIWREAKIRILVNFRGTSIELLQSHLDFFSFLYEFKYEDAFENFMLLLGNREIE